MKTNWQPKVTYPKWFFHTDKGFYILADDSGHVEVLALEDEAQITCVWTQRLALICNVDHLTLDSDHTSLIAVCGESVKSCQLFPLNSIIGESCGDNCDSIPSASSNLQNFDVRQVFLNLEGSLVYSLTERRLICEATGTLNPVQIYSLCSSVLYCCYSHSEVQHSPCLFLFFADGHFVVLRCPSFETLFESSPSKPYSSPPAFVFFHQQLLILVFDEFIEIWDCKRCKKVLINIFLEAAVQDALVDDNRLQMLMSNGAVKIVNLCDITWDLVEWSVKEPSFRTFSYFSPSLQDVLIVKFCNSCLLVSQVFKEQQFPAVDIGLDTHKYIPFYAILLRESSLCVAFDDVMKQQIILKVFKLCPDSKLIEIESFYSITDDVEKVSDRCRSNPDMLRVSPDASVLLWWNQFGQMFISKTEISERKSSSMEFQPIVSQLRVSGAHFLTSNDVFVVYDNGSFALLDLELMQTSSLKAVPDFGTLHKAEVFLSGEFSLVLLCDRAGLLCFWMFYPGRYVFIAKSTIDRLHTLVFSFTNNHLFPMHLHCKFYLSIFSALEFRIPLVNHSTFVSSLEIV